MDVNQTTAILNEHTRLLVNYNNTSELGASHIENIVMGELINSGNNYFKGLQISATYFNGVVSETIYNMGKPPLNIPSFGNLNKLQSPHTREYYLKTHFNIYTEHGLPDQGN